MSETDFKNWLRVHRAAYAGLDEWIGKRTKQQALEGEQPLTQAAILREWFLILRGSFAG